MNQQREMKCRIPWAFGNVSFHKDIKFSPKKDLKILVLKKKVLSAFSSSTELSLKLAV